MSFSYRFHGTSRAKPECIDLITRSSHRRLGLLMCNLARGPLELTNTCADYVLHEQIVILFTPSEVLSKEQRSRLNK